MKNRTIILSLAFLSTGCATMKPSGSPQDEKKETAKRSQVEFIDGVSIKPGSPGQSTQQQISTHSNYQIPPPVRGTEPGIEGYLPVQFKYAILLDAPVEQMDNIDLLNFLEEWYGTRYHYGGTTKEGIDCSAFVSSLMSSVYHIDHLPRMSKDQYNATRRISKKDLREGDLVFFHTLGKRKSISHVGVYLRNNKFVHASISGVMISNLAEGYYLTHYVGAGRIVAMPNEE